MWRQAGRIVDADTEINAHDPNIVWGLLPDDPRGRGALSPEIDLQNALTHELGHVLGLDHPCYLVDPPDPPEVTNEGAPVPSCSDPALPASVVDATMYPSATPGSIGERTLSADEVLALHDLYPAGRAPVVEGAAPASGGCVVAGEASAPSGTALRRPLRLLMLVAPSHDAPAGNGACIRGARRCTRFGAANGD